MHFENCPQGHIFKLKHFKFNTDIDPGSDFMEPDSGETSIDASSGPSFRKPGPGSSHDSGYVE